MFSIRSTLFFSNLLKFVSSAQNFAIMAIASKAAFAATLGIWKKLETC